MPQTYARVVATDDPQARCYVGHVGAVMHVMPAAPKSGLQALLILEFANGVREVFRASQLAPAREGDVPSPDAKPLTTACKPEPKNTRSIRQC